MKPFFLVLARDEKYVHEKIEELENLGMPYLIVCGQELNHPNIVYREPKGKYDAINFGFRFIPTNTDVVVLNDVDTRIRNFEAALRWIDSKDVALVFAKVCVREGPQRFFYGILDYVRRRYPIVASGELMLVKYSILKKIIPIKPCKAEDTYVLFKILECRGKTVFCEECYVETERTTTAEEEKTYKRRTVGGIYQALAYTNPPSAVKFFYAILPMASLLLLVSGKKGYFWVSGILHGFTDYVLGDKTGSWTPKCIE
jgi:cellulose synthase/poly-beta-1,6-N-acetylglucosamine synthase-like glycosyltransferase